MMTPTLAEMGIVRRRRKVCSVLGCPNLSGDKRKTGGMCWHCWWNSLGDGQARPPAA